MADADTKYYLNKEGVLALWSLVETRLSELEAKLDAKYLQKPTIVTALPSDTDANSNIIYLLREDNAIQDEAYDTEEAVALRALYVDELPTEDTAKPNTVYFVPENQTTVPDLDVTNDESINPLYIEKLFADNDNVSASSD